MIIKKATAFMGEMSSACRNIVVKVERDNLRDQSVDGRITLH
jgi:hypothetical protein